MKHINSLKKEVFLCKDTNMIRHIFFIEVDLYKYASNIFTEVKVSFS